MKPVKVVSKQQPEHFCFVLRTLFNILEWSINVGKL